MISSKLLKWTEEKQIHIINVLHQNKSDTNARGHIGTELINKAETVLSVTVNDQNKEISIVEAQMCRGIEPRPFAFEIINGIPSIVENFEIRTESNKSRYNIIDLPDFEKFDLLEIAYKKGKEFGYGELVIQLKLAFKHKFTKAIGDNQIKSLITFCKNKDWLLQEKQKGAYTIGGFTGHDPKNDVAF